MSEPEIEPQVRVELEAAAFRRLVEHLRTRPDVQNIACDHALNVMQPGKARHGLLCRNRQGQKTQDRSADHWRFCQLSEACLRV